MSLDKLKYAAHELHDRVSAQGKVDWEKLDRQPLDRVQDTSINCIIVGDLDHALFGLLYLYYQKHGLKPTNKTEELIKHPSLKYQEPTNEQLTLDL